MTRKAPTTNAFTGFFVSAGAYTFPTNFSSRPLSPRAGSLVTGQRLDKKKVEKTRHNQVQQRSRANKGELKRQKASQQIKSGNETEQTKQETFHVLHERHCARVQSGPMGSGKKRNVVFVTETNGQNNYN